MPDNRSFVPRLLSSPNAAYYLGISETNLRGLDIPRKMRGGKRLYDKADLDNFADQLPYEAGKENTCDAVFD